MIEMSLQVKLIKNLNWFNVNSSEVYICFSKYTGSFCNNSVTFYWIFAESFSSSIMADSIKLALEGQIYLQIVWSTKSFGILNNHCIFMISLRIPDSFNNFKIWLFTLSN